MNKYINNKDTIEEIIIEGGKKMEKDRNPSIECEVMECKYHSQDYNYCTLDKILVGKHEERASQVESTDCESFKLK